MKYFSFMGVVLCLIGQSYLNFIYAGGNFDVNGGQNENYINHPRVLHGFDEAHRAGLQGEGESIVFIEGPASKNHPIFSEARITTYDVSHYEEPVSGAIDRAGFRYNNAYESFVGGTSLRRQKGTHGNHVIGLAVGQPFQGEKGLRFEGGAVPLAQAVIITYSSFSAPLWNPAPTSSGLASRTVGISLYTVADSYDNQELNADLLAIKREESCGVLSDLDGEWRNERIKDMIDRRQQIDHQPPLIQEHLTKYPMDESLLRAFEQAFQVEGCVINVSSVLTALCDPLTQCKIPERVVNWIGEQLKERNKILVLSANNNRRNLSEEPGEIFQYYFQQFAAHNAIAERFLIAVNIEKTNELHSPQVTLPNGETTRIKLYHSSNYPGDKLKNFSVVAFGSAVVSGWDDQQEGGRKLLSVQSGTSEAAPLVSSLCALWKQKYPDMSAPEIVQRIKETTISVGDQDYFGHGIINAAVLSDYGLRPFIRKPQFQALRNFWEGKKQV